MWRTGGCGGRDCRARICPRWGPTGSATPSQRLASPVQAPVASTTAPQGMVPALVSTAVTRSPSRRTPVTTVPSSRVAPRAPAPWARALTYCGA